MANGEIGRLRDFLLSVVLPGVVGVDVTAVEPPGGTAAGESDGYRVEFERRERRVFVISQPTYSTLMLGASDRECAGKATNGWIVTEPSRGGAERAADQIFPSLRSAALFAAERAGVVVSL